MAALNCDKDKAFHLSHDAGHCDSRDSVLPNVETNSSMMTVDPKRGDVSVSRNPLPDVNSVKLTAGDAGAKMLGSTTVVSCSRINTSEECFVDQSLSRISGNNFFSEPLCKDGEVSLRYRERPRNKVERDASSVSQGETGAVMRHECNASMNLKEMASGIPFDFVHEKQLIGFSCEQEMNNYENENKILRNHEFLNNNKLLLERVSEADDFVTLEKGEQGGRKVVEGVKECPVAGSESMKNVTVRRKLGGSSAAKVGPDAELSQVLQRRSNYLSDWEVQLSSQEAFTEADRRVFEYEKKLEEEKTRRQCQLSKAMPVIINDELSKIMSERKVVVDSLTSLDEKREVDDVENKVAKSASLKPVLSLDSEVIDVALVTENKVDLDSEANAAEKRLNQEANLEARCEKEEILGSQRKVLGVSECSYKVRSGDMSKLNAEGAKVMESEAVIRKSSWAPTSHSCSNPFESSPRQKTQPVTSKEVEEALQSSSLSPEFIPVHGAALDGKNRPKTRGILKTHEHEKAPLRGILKHPSDHKEAPVKGILKPELPATEADSKNIHGILKHDSASTGTDRRHQGILRRKRESTSQLPLRGALKRDFPQSPGGRNDMEPEVAPSWLLKEQLPSSDQSSEEEDGVEAEAGSTTFLNEYCTGIEQEEENKNDEGGDGDVKGDSRPTANKGEFGSASVQKGDIGESTTNKGDSGSASMQKGDSGTASVQKRDSGLYADKGDSRSTEDKGEGESATDKGDSISAGKRGDNRSAANKGDSGSATERGDSGLAASKGDNGSAANKGESGLAANVGDSGSTSSQDDSGSTSDQGDSRSASDQGDNGSASDQGDIGSASDQGDIGSASDQGDSGSASDQGDIGSASDQEDSGSASNQEDSFLEGSDADMNSKYLRPDLGRSVSHIRHLTEPTTSDARQEAEAFAELPDIKPENITPKSSVSDRLAALQNSGENWKRRREQVRDIIPGRQLLSSVASNDAGLSETIEVKRRVKLAPQPTTRPDSIADRLQLLRGAQEGWKSKVTEKDTKMFTVQEKLVRHGFVMETPPQSKIDTPRREIRPKVVKIEVMPPSDDSQKMEEAEEKAPVVVEVPTVDSKLLTEFFTSRSAETTSKTKVDVTVDDFDHIFLNSNDVLKPIRKPTPKRTQAGSRNPLKTMSQHITLQNEYREESTGIAEKELKRIKKERVVGTPLLAQEALAGLASKENFSKVLLRKAESFHRTGLGERHLPYKELMLLQVKGRKWCQTRLTEPRCKSINSGDCYLLVTPDIVFLYVGKFSNVIERNKSSELATQICQKHDLCVRPACELAVLDEEKMCRSKVLIKFWMLLGGNESSVVQGPGRRSDEDDWYEASINLTNRVYSFRQDALILVPEYSGKLLKHEMLRSTEVYVFDFGSEMYVWIGKQADFDKRRIAVKLAFDLWQKGYDYKDDVINPLSPLVKENDGGIPASGKERPKWALFAKINQNMETILFKEKFIDWPDATRLIKAKGRLSEGEGKADLISDLRPCDAKKMFETCQTSVTMILEGSHVGRGKTWEEVQDGIKWEYEIRTHDTKVWHVTEYSAQELDPSSYGQFHSDDTYVVRWHYSIHQIARTLKGEESRKMETGRLRCAYFFWQGQHSSVNEKGASALMTVELDTERGPQVQISQGKEPPCFLNLFNGQMVIHLGKRSSESHETAVTWKFFIARNELPTEIYLLEIPVAAKNLRSRTSFVLVNIQTGLSFVWHGAKSVQSVQKATVQIAANLGKRCPKEFSLAKGKVINVVEIHEGSETTEFWSVFGGRCPRSSYGSLLGDPHSYNKSPRLFFMTSVSGSFEAKEIPKPVANDSGVVSAYPFLQADLYIEEQPALFLLDNHHEVYLWQGWWPVQTIDGENVHTGSAETRFNVNRKCAMETALAYSREISATKPPPVYLVYAGCEPVQFTSLFPRWQPDERAVVSPSKGSRKNGSLDLVADVLAKLTRNDYTFEELKQRPLPEGVDPLKLEMYLADKEFEMVVGMKRKDFSELQTWRQTEIKQKVGLF